MNRKLLALVLLAGGVQAPSFAALQFTNLSLSLPVLANSANTLRSVCYDGASKFVAVGDSEMYVAGSFTTNQSFVNNANWARTNALNPSGSASLSAVVAGGGLFVATGDNNLVLNWDGVTAFWTTSANVFPNGAQGEA